MLGLTRLVSAAFALGLTFAPVSAQAPAPTTQSPEQATPPEKVDKWVRDACGTHPIIQVQAARRVAAAGKDGIAALERYVEANGTRELSSSLVETLGRADLPETRALLRRWLADPGFPWPPQALRAYARIATEAQRDDLLRWSRHPAHIQRAAAMEGLGRLLAAAPEDAALRGVLRRGLSDPHPFVRAHAAAQLLQSSGQGHAAEAVEVLRASVTVRAPWFGADLGQPTRRVATEALRAAGFESAEGGSPLADTPERDFVFGYELVSCRRGDAYVRVDAEGRLLVGLYAPREQPQDAAEREALLAKIRALPREAPPSAARIYCDSVAMRGFGPAGDGHGRWAPEAVPGPFAELEQEFLRRVAPLLEDERRIEADGPARRD